MNEDNAKSRSAQAMDASCDEAVEGNEGMDGNESGSQSDGAERTQASSDTVNRLQPDVAMVLEAMTELELPAMESMRIEQARAFYEKSLERRPPGPEIGEIVDGVLPGAAGALDFRLYRPASPGPHPIIAYFHGGGWVLGSHKSDDPFCRDLCARSEAIIVSVDYRHAPEYRYPAAVDDGFAALQWIASNAISLGGDADRLAVAGWSAGGNVAAVVCQLARDAAGPAITGQLLLTPVTDCDLARPSYVENAEGYLLTSSLMEWFWNHYADPSERSDPKASPLRAADLANLPPAFIVTGEFDPLRDEGIAYAQALAAAGVPARQLTARGHLHASLTMVDVVPSGAEYRAQMSEALKRFFKTAVPA